LFGVCHTPHADILSSLSAQRKKLDPINSLPDVFSYKFRVFFLNVMGLYWFLTEPKHA